jgi:hypothetical protein
MKSAIASISRQIVTVGEGSSSSKLGVLLSLPPLFLIGMLQAIGGGFGI